MTGFFVGIIAGLAVFIVSVYAAINEVRFRLRRRQRRLDHQENQRLAAIEATERRRLATEQRQASARRHRRDAARMIRYLSRQLQVALLQLDQADDFRRAASWAEKCGDVPLAFRQRQFRRFRQKLIVHFARRLAAGERANLLMNSLKRLVAALGVSNFEADYVRNEAHAMQTPRERPQPRTFPQQLAERQEVHQRRLEALRQTHGLSEELREQLIEAEQERFREQMLDLGEATHAF